MIVKFSHVQSNIDANSYSQQLHDVKPSRQLEFYGFTNCGHDTIHES